MIDRHEIRAYCASKPGAEETFPFDATTLVVKVIGKMFALMPTDTPDDEYQSISLKCEPVLAELLRQTYDAVKPGYHLSKKHWNTVTLDSSIPDDEIVEMVDNSYALVVKGLTKAQKAELERL